MIVFDIESGRLEAPGFYQTSQAMTARSADAERHYLPVTELRLMTIAEAVWIESRQKTNGSR